MAILRLFITPLLKILQFWTFFISGLACVERIQKFLERDDFVDQRKRGRSLETGDKESHVKNGNTVTEEPHPGRSDPIYLKNCSFGYGEAEVLKNISIEISRGNLTMVVGRVGSGKSTLLHSLLGETRMTKGSLLVPDAEVAFCAQTPWLRNLSIRENIISVSEYEEAWYNRVVSCCNLNEDIDQFPDKHDTLVGSKGVALSGGQKNRIVELFLFLTLLVLICSQSLARALYARKSTYLLDDMLSGLDSRTEQYIFKRVFSKKGLLKDLGATTILVTHSKRYLPEADNIVVLESGSIAHSGSYNELSSSGALETISNADLINQGDDDNVANTEELTNEAEKSGAIKGPPMRAMPKKLVEDNVENNWESYKFFFRGYGYVSLCLFGIVVAISQGLQILQSVWLERWTTADDAGRTYFYVTFAVISLFAIVCSNIALRFYFLRLLPKLSLYVHAKQLGALMNATLAFVTATESGQILNRFSQDLGLVDGALPFLWYNNCTLTLSVLGSSVLIFLATPHVALAIPFIVLACYAIQRVFLRTSKQLRIIDLEAKAPLVSHLTETYAGLTSIRAFGWEEKFGLKNFAFLEDAQVPYYLMASIQNWLVLVLELLVAGLSTMVAILAVSLRSNVNPGYLGLALIGVMDIASSFRHLLQNWVQLDTSLGAIVRIKNFTDETPREKTEGTHDPPPGWPAAGLIEFNNVTASYAPGGEAVLKDVDVKIPAGTEVGICGRSGSGKTSAIGTLFGLLTIEGGEVKIDNINVETISLDKLRESITVLPQDPFFMPPVKGGNSVRAELWPWAEDCEGGGLQKINYHSIQTADADQKRFRQGYVPSDQTMAEVLEKVGLWEKFAEHDKGKNKDTATIQDNSGVSLASGVLINGEASTEETPLLATTTAAAPPLDEPMTARRVLNQRLDLREFLSHGERQLFCLARALLTRNRILVLDEATSSVDSKTEDRMLSLIQECFAERGWTRVAIAHRLNTIVESADRVVVMGGGKVLEQGQPQELKHVEGGVLKSMLGSGL
ncbi:MAG: hypothetical protein Q9227_007701 [Pyrenula ochraceoflavens]